MTTKEIQSTINIGPQNTINIGPQNLPLWEIALQLSKQNDTAKEVLEVYKEILRKMEQE